MAQHLLDKGALLEIERGFWFEGAEYYERHIADQAVFVFPGMRLDKDDGVTSADAAQRWKRLEIEDAEVIEVDDKVAILTYNATAQREGQEPYAGSITTVYRLEGDSPKMVFHQHTPEPG